MKSDFEFETRSNPPEQSYRPRNKSKTQYSRSPPRRSRSPQKDEIKNVDEIDLLPDLPERLDDIDQFLLDDEMDKMFNDGLERFKEVYIDH